jgi:hypothetical protein
MQRHWEISWTTLRPLSDEETERSVRAIAKLGCCSPDFVVEALDSRYVAVRHRRFEEFQLEFGFADQATGSPPFREAMASGLVQSGHVAWNWCRTGKERTATDLALYKLRQVQEITGDKLLVWDDDGMCHWAWGSCTLAEAGLDPMDIVDAHLRRLSLLPLQRLAS